MPTKELKISRITHTPTSHRSDIMLKIINLNIIKNIKHQSAAHNVVLYNKLIYWLTT